MSALYPVERAVATRKQKVHLWLNASFACIELCTGLEYLIMWKGYHNEDSSWIKESDCNLAAKRYVSYK